MNDENITGVSFKTIYQYAFFSNFCNYYKARVSDSTALYLALPFR